MTPAGRQAHHFRLHEHSLCHTLCQGHKDRILIKTKCPRPGLAHSCPKTWPLAGLSPRLAVLSLSSLFFSLCTGAASSTAGTAPWAGLQAGLWTRPPDVHSADPRGCLRPPRARHSHAELSTFPSPPARCTVPERNVAVCPRAFPHPPRAPSVSEACLLWHTLPASPSPPSPPSPGRAAISTPV